PLDPFAQRHPPGARRWRLAHSHLLSSVAYDETAACVQATFGVGGVAGTETTSAPITTGAGGCLPRRLFGSLLCADLLACPSSEEDPPSGAYSHAAHEAPPGSARRPSSCRP